MAERYDNVKHGKYVCELKAAYSFFKECTAPQIGALGANDLGGADFTVGYSYIDQPFLMVNRTHKHDFNQVIIFMGRDSNCVDYDSETDFTVDEQVYHITYPCVIYIPKMTWHGPLNIKRVTKPFMFFDIVLNPVPSTRDNQIVKQ
jgi:hypothetical protein